jgi:hypothetical protein
MNDTLQLWDEDNPNMMKVMLHPSVSNDNFQIFS